MAVIKPNLSPNCPLLLCGLLLCATVAGCQGVAAAFQTFTTESDLMTAIGPGSTMIDFEDHPFNGDGFAAFSNGYVEGQAMFESLSLNGDIELLNAGPSPTGLFGTFLVEDNVTLSAFVRPGGNDAQGTSACDDDFRVSFSPAVTAAGLRILDNRAESGETLTFLDENENVIATFTLPGGSLDAEGFIGMQSGPGDPLIGAIEINEGTVLNDDILFDNVIYASATTSVGNGPSPGLRMGSVHPNPFRAKATIFFSLDRSERITVVVYDVAGRRVRTVASRQYSAGRHFVLWDGLDDMGVHVGQGVYLVRLSGESRSVTRRTVRIR